MTLTHSFNGTHACILHPSEMVVDSLLRRLRVLGVTAEHRWPALAPRDCDAGLLIIDLDRAHDDQLPWERGQAPMPVVGLIGSESPGRLAWALEQRIDAFLPLSAAANIYSALVVAFALHARRVEGDAREAETARRAGLRLEVVSAVLDLMQAEAIDAARALKQLRAFAMVERLPLEDAASLYLSERGTRARGRA